MVAAVTHQCVANANGELCAAAWLAVETEPSSPFAAPVSCSAAVPAATNLGCCFMSGLHAYVGLISISNPAAAAAISARYTTITQCAGFPTAALTPCDRFNTTNKQHIVATLSKDIVCDYCNKNKAACQAALLSDFALSNAALTTDVSNHQWSCTSNKRTSTSSIVMSGDVQGNSDSQNALLAQQAQTGDWYLGNYYVASGPYYGASASAAITANLSLVLALVAVIMTLF
jgi:hypothetical protein